MTAYTDLIRETLARTGRVGAADPRHIEAYMRLEHPTLDALSADAFTAEVQVALDCIAYGGTADAESLARSFGY